MVSQQKVFCIGFHKTGTTSLAAALRILGYRVTGPNGVHDPNISQNVVPMARQLLLEYDAVQDNPWPILFRELDSWYPGSRFVLTTRDPKDWIASAMRHFGKEDTPMRTWIYGVGHPVGNEDTYLARFRSHYEEVAAYFRNRPQDILELDVTAGQGWERLCPFLGRDIPPEPFPFLNRASGRATKPGIWSILRRNRGA